MLEEASQVELDLIGMIHFHGWPGGCGYLSTTDKNTLKTWVPRFVAFVAAPDCLKAWRMRTAKWKSPLRRFRRMPLPIPSREARKSLSHQRQQQKDPAQKI